MIYVTAINRSPSLRVIFSRPVASDLPIWQIDDVVIGTEIVRW